MRNAGLTVCWLERKGWGIEMTTAPIAPYFADQRAWAVRTAAEKARLDPEVLSTMPLPQALAAISRVSGELAGLLEECVRAIEYASTKATHQGLAVSIPPELLRQLEKSRSALGSWHS